MDTGSFFEKDVWELTPDQAEYVYRHRHMNGYVYAALMTFHRSKMPLNRIVRLRNDRIPSCLHRSLDHLISLSPYLGNDSPRTVRVNYTYYAFEILSVLGELKLEDIPSVVELLATVAYIPIVAEKNDNLPLWMNPVLRRKGAETERVFESIGPKIDLEDFVRQPLWPNDSGIKSDQVSDNPLLLLYYFMPRAVQSILVMLENGLDGERAAGAFSDVERNMLRYEADHGIASLSSKVDERQGPYVSDQRYKNTLYLYGGNNLDRLGRDAEAFAWYTRDILFDGLPETFGFYLTALKTCERMITSFRLDRARQEEDQLRALLDRSLHQAFRAASIHAHEVRHYLATHADADLEANRLQVNDGKPRELLYATEAAREVFLVSLLYNWIVNAVPFREIAYEKYLRY